jgi:5-methylcytosine-specific restriction endonuclease McrA
MPSRRPCLGPGRFHLSEPGESRCAQHRLTKWASKAGTSMGSGWATLRRRVLTEEPRCRSCGANATTVDHIVARAFGGGDDRENLAPLCTACHRKKTQADALEGRRRQAPGRLASVR